ncbi:hypothetical protein BX616_010662 [Lobosporangium transversale]|uniref:Uncharacterized protein n=1 Tax=Lobosporangium transversale TaxID=64571 RepID=A0A1Y2G7B1_9FUNG|nr:hypothetical protein BCR41DRAFT_390392 [Lobosporangium transversale]KAF9911158.1 hypothetical protein BX616_010662 [Lobosporangium transversale]ORY99685.1 hypothetical protein BCR41DRAFT_390392 [Lobosporangium transversale]|eukprot:XP_021875949.1 hypothetical protein BCR41DRAFT_390392 [Lobosporangium transversale]
MVVSSQSFERPTIDIGDGLIMRWSSKADTDNVINLVGDAFRWIPYGDPLPENMVPPPNEYFMAGARRMLSGKNAAMSGHDYALVEDTKRAKGRNPIVACAALHKHPAYYGSINLQFGKPELIACDPEYRGKGLIRRLLFEMIHPASDARGDDLQFIGGIPYFYRQFGYEYALYVCPGTRFENADAVPALAKGETEPYNLRRATVDDIPLLIRLSHPEKRHAIAQVGLHYTPEYWQYTVHDIYEDKQHRFDADRDTRIIVDVKTGMDVGFTVVSHGYLGPQLEAMALEEDLVKYIDAKDSVLRQLFQHARERQEIAAREYELYKKKIGLVTEDDTNGPKPIRFSFGLQLNKEHPLSILVSDKIKDAPNNICDYLLYARIPSYKRFIQKITPELEKRLADSVIAGISGRLRLNFFRRVEGQDCKGLQIFLEKGKIVDVQNWAPLSDAQLLEERLQWKAQGTKAPTIYVASFGPLTFSSLITGKNSVEELVLANGENLIKDNPTRTLLETLFPKVDHHIDSYIW